MLLNIENNSNLFVELKRKYKRYLLNIKIKSKYFNYDMFTKIRYDNLITLIENIENMLFSKDRYANDIDLDKIRIEFSQFDTTIKISIKISNNQEYSIVLNRKNILDLYNYLVRYLKTFNKIQQMDFKKKYTYVEVRYIDVYSSRRYSYIAENKNIKIGDIVYVDRAGKKCLAVVENKNDYYYEQAPYPVLETKRVIRVVTRAEKYRG